jgi:hypothetical protein
VGVRCCWWTDMDIRTVTFSCNYLYIDYYDLLMPFVMPTSPAPVEIVTDEYNSKNVFTRCEFDNVARSLFTCCAVRISSYLSMNNCNQRQRPRTFSVSGASSPCEGLAMSHVLLLCHRSEAPLSLILDVIFSRRSERSRRTGR